MHSRRICLFAVHLAAIAVMALIGLPNSVMASEACTVRIAKEQSSSARTVFLTGGAAKDLFQRYLAEAEKQSLKIDLWKIKVITSNGKECKEHSLNWIEMLTGQGAKERWAGLLQNEKAGIDKVVFNDAERQQWDIICYDKEYTVISEQGGVGSFPSSEETTSRAPGSVPLDAKQNFQQGMQYAARRDFQNAINEFTNAIQKYPPYAAAYSNRGVAYMQQKKFDLAEDDLKKAVELGPKDPNNHYNLTCWYSLQNQLGRGLVSLDATLANGFSDYDALRKDPDLSNLRKHSDWQKTLEKHKVFLEVRN